MKYLSKTSFRIVIIIVSIISVFSRFELSINTQKYTSDYQYQLQATKNLIAGNGITTSYVDTLDISKSIYIKLGRPEGYSYMTALPLIATDSMYWSQTFVTIFALAIFFLCWFIFFKHFENDVDKTVAIPVLLILGFNVSPWLDFGITGWLSIAFYMLASVLTLNLFRNNLNIKTAIFIGFCLFMTVFIRYAYYPTLIVIPISLVFLWLYFKNKTHLKHLVIITLSFAFFSLISFLIMTKGVKGNATDLVGTQTNGITLLFDNLLKLNYSFPIQAILDDRFFFTLFSKLKLSVLEAPIKLLVSIVIFVFIVISIIRDIKHSKSSDKKIFFLLFSTLSILGTFGYLVLFSILATPQNNDVLSSWTFVQEIRYYAPAFVSILLLISYYTFKKSTKKFAPVLRYSMYLIACISVGYGLISRYALINATPQYFTTGNARIWANNLSDEKTGHELETLITKNTIDNVRPIYLSTDRTHQIAELMGAEYGGALFGKFDKLRTHKDVVILVKLSEKSYYPERERQLVEFCQKHHSQEVIVGTYKIHKVVIKPQKN